MWLNDPEVQVSRHRTHASRPVCVQQHIRHAHMVQHISL